MTDDFGALPPLLGFEDEHLITTPKESICSDFYTCMYGGKRVFVWAGYGEWLVQLDKESKRGSRSLIGWFQNCDVMHTRVRQGDPLALKAVIIELAGGPS